MAERTLHLILSIDTEGDNLWAKGDGRVFRNIERLPEFQGFCEELGLRPTYLVAYEVVEDDSSRAVIQQLARNGNCEIGAHLHAWLTPPYYEPLEPPGKHPYLHEYPEELRLAKLETVTRAIEDAIGKRPTSYRGGRWSIDAFTMRSIDELGYGVETTITPFVSWAIAPGTSSGGMNFVAAPLQPYHPSPDDPTASGDLNILEVPSTHRPKGAIPSSLYRALGRWLGDSPVMWRLILRYFLNRLGKVVHPNPASESPSRLVWLARRVAGENAPVLNLAFHSSELMAGGAPWVVTQRDQERTWASIAAAASELSQHTEWQASTLTQFREEWSASATDQAHIVY